MWEMSVRGVTEVDPAELDFLVRLVGSPRRTAAGLIARQVRDLAGVVGFLRDVAREDAWLSSTEPPEGLQGVAAWRPDQLQITIDVPTRELAPARHVLARLFAEAPRTRNSGAESDQVRPLEVWLSSPQGGDPTSPVVLHIGEHSITELSGDHVDLARRLINAYGDDQHAIAVAAEARGRDVDTGRLRLFLPDRP